MVPHLLPRGALRRRLAIAWFKPLLSCKEAGAAASEEDVRSYLQYAAGNGNRMCDMLNCRHRTRASTPSINDQGVHLDLTLPVENGAHPEH